MLNGFATAIDSTGSSAALVIRQTNLNLVTFTLGATPFASAFSDSIIVTGPPITNAAVAVLGNANNFRLLDEDSAVCLTGTISAVGGGGDIELPSVSVTVTTIGLQRLNTFILRMGPTGALTVEASMTLT
jgi:hypothetical protein